MEQIARNIASVAFVNKVDKGGHPYILHLNRVSDNADDYWRKLEGSLPDKTWQHLRIVGLLHDLLEDCPEWTATQIRAIFVDNEIINALLLLTKQKGKSYDEYIEEIKNNKIARCVKLADLRDNMDVTRLTEITDKDIQRLKKYHRAYHYLLSE